MRGGSLHVLRAAALLEEYTLTDFALYLRAPQNITAQLTIYKRGQDDDELLSNPVRLLVGAQAQDLTLAKEFAAWATSKEGGQAVIAQVTK